MKVFADALWFGSQINALRRNVLFRSRTDKAVLWKN